MKRFIAILFFQLFFVFNLKAQTSIKIPDEIDFCGLRLLLSPEVKQEMSQNVSSVIQSQEYFKELLDRTDTYFRIIDKIFEDNKIHTDLKYIVLHESGLMPEAQGAGDATGFWQISKKDALGAGLLINEVVDERLNIIESTKMVSLQLQKYNSTFNNWIYSALAFHLGLEQAIAGAEYKYYSARKMLIDAKTHWFIIKTISYKLAFSDFIGKNKSPRVLLFEYQAIKNQTLFDIADINHVSPELVKEYNKWFTGAKIPEDKPYIVFVPLQSEVGVQQGIPRELYSNMPPPIFLVKNGLRAIQAKFGDVYEKLALDGGITVKQLYEYNEIGPFTPIYHGQVCYLEKKNKKPSKIIPPFHLVKYGQNIWNISQYYGLMSSTIREYNWLTEGTDMKPPEEPKLGQKLWLHQKRPEDAGIEIVLSIDEPSSDPNLSALNNQQDDWLGDEKESDFIYEPKEVKQEEIPDPSPEKTKRDTNNNKEILLKYVPPEQEVVSNGKDTVGKEQLTVVNGTLEQANVNQNEKKNIDTDSTDTKRYVTKKEDLIKNISDSTTTIKNDKTHPAPIIAYNTQKEKTDVPTSNSSKNKKPETSNQKPPAISAPTYVSVQPVVENYTFHIVEPNQNLFRISMLYKVSVNDIKKWNDLNNSDLTLGQKLKVYKSTPVAVESGRRGEGESGSVGDDVKQSKELNTTTNVFESKTHIVKQGETVQSVIKLYKITLPDLKKWNNLANLKITNGQKLIISAPKTKEQVTASNQSPVTSSQSPVTNSQSPETSSQKPATRIIESGKVYHIVNERETIFNIANQYKMGITQLMQLNHLSDFEIMKGQKLLISENEQSMNEKFDIHTVAAGETILTIATKYSCMVTEIMKWNNKPTMETKVGEKLKIRK